MPSRYPSKYPLLKSVVYISKVSGIELSNKSIIILYSASFELPKQCIITFLIFFQPLNVISKIRLITVCFGFEIIFFFLQINNDIIYQRKNDMFEIKFLCYLKKHEVVQSWELNLKFVLKFQIQLLC